MSKIRQAFFFASLLGFGDPFVSKYPRNFVSNSLGGGCFVLIPFVHMIKLKFLHSSQSITFLILWEPSPSYHNGLFSPLLVLKISLPEGWSIPVLSEQYETFYHFYVTLSFLCNIICYLIPVFVFSLVTLSRATTPHSVWTTLVLFFYAKLPHSIIVWLIVSTLLPHNLILLLCWVISIFSFNILDPYGVVLCCLWKRFNFLLKSSCYDVYISVKHGYKTAPWKWGRLCRFSSLRCK